MSAAEQPVAVGGGPRRQLTIRRGPVALRVNARALLLTAATLLATLIVATWAMTLGSFSLSFGEVAGAMFGRGSPDSELVVRSLRLPRVLSAIMVGGALAMSGAIFQALVRNPLVSPDVIGIESGATLCAVLWISTGQDAALLPAAAFGGAVLAAAVVYVLTWHGGIDANRLILVGIGVAACATAGTTFALVRFPIFIARAAEVWTLGSVYGSDARDVWLLAGALLLLTPAALLLTWRLRPLQMGDAIARGLGLSIERTRLELIVVACGLAAVAIAVAGPIGFVALMVPHMARMLAGPISGSVLLFTGVLGGCFLLVADIIAQHYLPVTLPVGVITAAVGGPYFLLLLYRSNARM